MKASTGSGFRQQQTTGGRGRITPGTVARGVISAHNYEEKTYTVRINGQHVPGCVDISGLCSALVGFKTSSLIAVGTQVAVLCGNPGWILGAYAADKPDKRSRGSRSMTHAGKKDAHRQLNPKVTQFPPTTPANDMFQGEFEIANLLGTFIRFLTGMISIGGSERAKVECHLFRDLVRVVSENYEHFASPCDIKMFNDGRLNVEINGTSFDHERWGLVNPDDPKFEGDGTTMPEEDPAACGRWRYTLMLGFLGDLFNGWFSDPAATIGRMAEEALRAGNARLHIGEDGTLLAQSCGDIVIEHVHRIPVPIRLKHEEDPEGVLRSEMDALDKNYLKVWKQEARNAHHTLFKVREYVRYLNQYHSIARILQLQAKKGEFKVPSEAETPRPSVSGGSKDREEANPDITFWRDAYATIRIYRDGSILSLDAYGNATASGPYGIRHSSVRHFAVFAAGDIIMKAGGSIFASARRHLELAASRGGLVLKARTFMRALCEAGTVWIKSDLDPENPYTPAEGDPAAESFGDQGVRIQTSRSKTRIVSNKSMRLVVEDPNSVMEVESKGDFKLQTQKDLHIKAWKNLRLQVGATIYATSIAWRIKASSWILDGIAKLSAARCEFNRLRTYSLLALQHIGGPKRLGVPEPMDPPSRCCMLPHTNHIGIYDPPEDERTLDLAAEVPAVENLEADTASMTWQLVNPAEYKWPDPEGMTGVDDVEPLTQQQLRLDNTAGYGSWSGMSDRLLQAPGTSGDTPWPGASYRWLSHNPSKPRLDVPSELPPASFAASIQTPLTSDPCTFRFLLK